MTAKTIQTTAIRKAIKTAMPYAKISVRNGTGTACWWLEIWTTREDCRFTSEEREGFAILGLPRAGGNCLVISPDERNHYAKLLGVAVV